MATADEGIGTKLMDGIEEAARGADFSQAQPLSRRRQSRATVCYERLGYETLTVDDDGVRMLKEL